MNPELLNPKAGAIVLTFPHGYDTSLVPTGTALCESGPPRAV
jgi:hypothetical protein